MKHVIIRQVTDIDSLVDMRMEVLKNVFGVDRVSQNWDELKEATRHYYEQHIADGTHIACMAYTGYNSAFGDGLNPDLPHLKILAGCGALCIQREMPSPANPSGLCAYLMNMYVRKACRQQGIGTAIIRWLVDKAHSLGCGKIYLESPDGSLPLYEELGFDFMSNMMHFDKKRS